MTKQTQFTWPLLLAAIAEGVALASVYGYGPLYMREVLGQSSLQMSSLTIALTSLASFVMAAIWGRWGDRTGKLAMLISVGHAIGTVGLIVLAKAPTAPVFIMSTVIMAGGVSVSAPLAIAWLTQQTPGQPGVAAARFYRARTIGWAVGSFGASYAVQRFQLLGVAIMFQLGAIATALVSIWMAYVVIRSGQSAISRPNYGEPLAVEPTYDDEPCPSGALWRQPLVWSISGAVLLGFGGNEAFVALMGPYFTEYLHGSASWVGVALGTASVTGIVAIGLIGRLSDRIGPKKVFTYGMLGYVMVYGLLSLFRYPLPTILLFNVPLYPFIATGATGLLVRFLPHRQRGEAIGIYEGSAALAASLGSLLGGRLADRFGLASAPYLSFVLAVAGTLVAWVGVSKAVRGLKQVQQV